MSPRTSAKTRRPCRNWWSWGSAPPPWPSSTGRPWWGSTRPSCGRFWALP